MDYESAFRPLLVAGRKYGIRPDVPAESDAYFRDLISKYRGRDEDLIAWLEDHISSVFRSFGERPVWVQDPEWPVFKGRPMTFVGQIERTIRSTPLLNHDACFYVFWDTETGATKVVIQAD